MKIIYEPAGKAKEHCELAANLFKGCSHQCQYCYAPAVLHIPREAFATVTPRKNVLELLEKDVRSNDGAGRDILLSFTTDIYCKGADPFITREAIRMLIDGNYRVNILTKAGLRSTTDFDILAANHSHARYGATLTFYKDTFSRIWEPGAALPGERMEALARAHDLGIPVFVSLEPIIDVEQSLHLIELTHLYVDKFLVGKWNYDARANAIDWPAFARDAIAIIEGYGKEYYIKKDLAVYLPGGDHRITYKPCDHKSSPLANTNCI